MYKMHHTVRKFFNLTGLILLPLFLYGQDIEVTVFPEALHRVDHRIFGHFLERPSWGGERGIEDAVLDKTGELDKRVLKKLKGLDIPVLRFPGGTDIDYMDWTDMIDLPERQNRPVSIGNSGDKVTNRFGIDEFAMLIRETNSEAIIPLNFFDPFLKRVSLDSAALHMAGLVAYANADTGQVLPEGMRDWPAVRAANGHPDPFKFKYFQIGNETWALWNWKKQLLENADLEDPYQWYVECVIRYVEMIEAIDPEVEIIADYINSKMQNMLLDALGDRIDYYVFHKYMPWAMKPGNIKKDGKSVSTVDLTKEEVWYAFVSVPNTLDSRYMSSIGNSLIPLAEKHGFKIAVTEWNWNGWWDNVARPPLYSYYAQSVGVAGFLHGMAKNGHVIEMGCQSMLVGSSWGITGIRVDDSQYWPPYYLPSSQMTSFYAKHHGTHRLRSEIKNMPVFKQPLQLASIRAKNKVALVDVLVTGSSDSVSVFFINRDYREEQLVTLDLTAFDNLGSNVRHVILTGELDNANVNIRKDAFVYGEEKLLDSENGICRVNLPKRSVSVVQAPGYLTTVNSSPESHPQSLKLKGNYPNPFNPSTVIEYSVYKPGLVRLGIYDINGRLIRTLSAQRHTTGDYRIEWDGRDNHGLDVASGMYLMRLSGAGSVQNGKLMKLK